MLRPRIIPCLLIQNNGLVKTVNFKNPKYVGDPLNAVKIFNEKQVDELIVINIDNTVHNQEPDYDLIKNLALECRMPLCYGGGIKTVEQARRIIELGVEKTALSSAAMEYPELIAELAEQIGNQSVVVVLDVKKRLFSGRYDCWIHNGKKNTKKSPIEMASQFEKYGAGEIVINSIDNDGMMQGYDTGIVNHIRKAIHIPLTVLGGAGSLEDIGKLIQQYGIIGAAAGSLFVFKGIYKAVLINYPKPEEKDILLKSFFSV